MPETTVLTGLVVLTASLVAAITDIWKFKVYNAQTLPLLLSGVLYNLIVGGQLGMLGSIYGVLFGFGVFIVPYMVGAMGAGDVKFMAAVGAWLGIPAMFYVTLIGCLATGLYAIVVVLYEHRLKDTWINLQIIWHRLLTIGRFLRVEDDSHQLLESVQSMAKRSDRRSRLVPVTALMALGIAAIMIWHFIIQK